MRYEKKGMRMNVEISYFGPAREALGVGREVLEIAEMTDVDRFMQHLAAVRPAIAHLIPACRLAIGERYASSGEVLSDGDRLAIIPPVAGG